MGIVKKKEDSAIVKLLKRFITPMKSAPKQQVSEFVKRMRALSDRNFLRLVWNSSIDGTYVKSKHGKLE